MDHAERKALLTTTALGALWLALLLGGLAFSPLWIAAAVLGGCLLIWGLIA